MSENEDTSKGNVSSRGATRDAEAIQDIQEWMRHILDQKRWTPTDLARQAEVSPSTLLRILNDDKHRFIPSFRTVKKISDASGYPLSEKLQRVFSSDALKERDVRSQQAVTKDFVARGHLPPMRATVPVRFVSSLPRTLHPKQPGEDRAACPVQMEGDATAFAFYVPDNGMSPWVQAGALVYASQRNDPKEDDIVLIETSDGKSVVRMVSDIDEKGIHVTGSDRTKSDTFVFEKIEFVAVVRVMLRL